MIYGYETKDLANYPGDLVLRTSSSKVAGYFKKELEYKFTDMDIDELQKMKNFYENNPTQTKTDFQNIITMTIIANSLEESVVIAEKVNKKTTYIVDNIIEKILEKFLKENNLEELDGNDEEFEYYVMNLEGNVSLKLNISGKDHNNKKFTSEVILRSNGGYDEIIKALPYISSEEYMKKKIANAIEQ